MIPPSGFTWEFLAGVWALKPAVRQPVLKEDCSAKETSEQEKLQSSSDVMETLDSLYESDDSVSEFERNLRELMPNLLRGSKSVIAEQPRSTQRSESPKKHSSRFNEEAGYIVEPPKSTKKKVSRDDIEEG